MIHDHGDALPLALQRDLCVRLHLNGFAVDDHHVVWGSLGSLRLATGTHHKTAEHGAGRQEGSDWMHFHGSDVRQSAEVRVPIREPAT